MQALWALRVSIGCANIPKAFCFVLLSFSFALLFDDYFLDFIQFKYLVNKKRHIPLISTRPVGVAQPMF